MTHTEWTKIRTTLRCAIARTRHRMKRCDGLQEKLAVGETLKVLQQQEWEHRLNYFELTQEC
jgi:hypothetical protein